MNNILQKYIKQVDKDLEINEFNLKESTYNVPAKKHFWVARLIEHKQNLIKLQKDREIEIKNVVEEIVKESPVRVSQPVAEKTALKHSKIKTFDENIKLEELIITYLEKVEKTFSSLTWDTKNIIETVKMETL